MAVRTTDQGVVLINVLVILALTASVVYAMVSLSKLSITRSQRFSSAGQALALIAAGRFALKIEDAQGRFNLNSLPGSGALGAQILQRIVVALELPLDVGPRIAARLAQADPLVRMADLVAEAGISADDVARLAELVTVLPGRTGINVNTAPEALLGAIADNPVQARRLAGIRTRNGFLTPADITQAQMILPSGVGFVSRFFWVTTNVTVDGTAQRMETLVQRRPGRGGPANVVAVFRQVPVGAIPPPQ